jgi:hypothetical protein
VVPLPLPFGATRATNEIHFAGDKTVEAVLEVLGAIDEDRYDGGSSIRTSSQ